MINSNFTIDEDHVSPEPYFVYERILFEWCLVRINSRWITGRGRGIYIARMRSMALKKPSLIHVALNEMIRSPRLAHDCLVFFLSLPDEILETDPFLKIKFLVLSDANNVRKEIESCLKCVTVCFLEKIGSVRDAKGPLYANI